MSQLLPGEKHDEVIDFVKRIQGNLKVSLQKIALVSWTEIIQKQTQLE